MKMEQREPLVSVIVPVYNVERYVEKCLASIAAQTYTHIEIIVIDDASTDSSGRLCDACAAEDCRMRVFHLPENRGLSAARNAGVERARGAFACFVDSDDYIEPEMVEKLYGSLQKTGADISVCGNDGMKLKAGPAGSYSQEEAVCCLAKRSPFLWTAWGKLYPMHLIREHPFDKQALCCEDLLFFYQILKQAKQVSYLPDPLYHYICRGGSLINSGIDRKRCTVLPVAAHICEDARKNFPEAVPGFQQVVMNTSVRLAMQAVEGGVAEGQLSDYLKSFRNHVRRHFSLKALRLCPDKKDLAAELALYAGATFFKGMAAVYQYMKRAGTKDGVREPDGQNGSGCEKP